jgi:transcriptional regulator with XRE-family HTH domain
MPTEQAPVVQRALLLSELRRLRTAKHLSQEDVAKALEWSLSKVIRIEGGVSRLQITDLKALLDLYEVTNPEQVNELLSLARAARERGYWSAYKNISDQGLLTYVGYEAGASIIREAQGLVIPGLLQTEEYAWEITRSYIGDSNNLVKDLVDLRVERQEKVYGRNDPMRQFYVWDEAVIRRRVGGSENPALMPDQLRHLAELAARPEITVEVITFETGAHFGLKGPFIILQFDSELGDVLYMESTRRGDLTRGDPASAEEITSYREAFERLRELSLGRERSAQLIREVAEEMSRNKPIKQ